MIFGWGPQSRKNFHLLSKGLQRVATRTLHYGIMDFTIICSFRNEVTQNKFYKEGKSRVPWPKGKHNKIPAKAMDCVPNINGLSWNKLHCCVLSGLIQAAAKEEGVKLRWGGNWDMDNEPVTDQDFQDLVHYEEVILQ